MRYFAMIDGERKGPFELDQLKDAGVRPDTYVWCKGMDDWEQAAEVADICRYWRQHIAELMSPPHLPALSQGEESGPQGPSGAGEGSSPEQQMLRQILGPENDNMLNPDPAFLETPPANMMIWAVLATLLCLPPTGFVAIYCSWQSSRIWKTVANLKGDEKKEAQKSSHDFARMAKMWVGITFFLGLILWSFILRFL